MRRLQIIIALLLILITTNANAALVRIDFTGHISSSGSFLDPTGLFAQGDSFSGFWEFDSAVSDSDPSLNRGLYSQSGTPAFQITIGSSIFQTDNYNLQILNDYTAGIGTLDAYDVLGGSSSSNIAGLKVSQMQFTIRDMLDPLDALANDLLFESAPDLSAFDQSNQAQGQIIGDLRESRLFMNLELDSVTSSSSVPEPATLFLLGTGLLGLAGLRRKKKA